MTGDDWPALKLQLMNANSEVLHTSVAQTSAKTTAPEKGKSFYFYSIWNGTNIDFIASKVVHVTEAGGLANAITALGHDKDAITTMIVTGNIKSTDFAVMKVMDALKYLDLLEANCILVSPNAFGYNSDISKTNTNTKISTLKHKKR